VGTLDPQKLFGKKLKDLRTARGISQEKLAEIAGVHRNFVGLAERGAQNISLSNLTKLAHALKVRPAELIKDIP
jgi:transcriptional regulator with XRE-family HTH domain